MIYIILLLFAAAATLGLVMLYFLFKKPHIPKGLAVLHGLAAATALVLLSVYGWMEEKNVWLPAAIFLLAALGGFTLLYKDLTSKAPRWLGLAHGLAAITAFILLLATIF